MKDLIIVGAGNAAREVLQIIKDINNIEKKWNIKGFIADTGQDIEILTNGDFKVIGSIVGWVPSKNEVFVCAISNPEGREKVVRSLESKGAVFERIIHPSARINDYCQIGDGVILYPNSSVGANAKIGNHVFIQSTAIAHDVVVGDFSTISALCGILGNVIIGKNVFIANHATIVPNKKVGDRAFIGVGSVVINNVKPGSKVFGNPARKIDL